MSHHAKLDTDVICEVAPDKRSEWLDCQEFYSWVLMNFAESCTKFGLPTLSREFHFTLLDWRSNHTLNNFRCASTRSSNGFTLGQVQGRNYRLRLLER